MTMKKSLVASVIGSSNANPDVSAIEDDLSDREVLAAYTVWIKPLDRAVYQTVW